MNQMTNQFGAMGMGAGPVGGPRPTADVQNVNLVNMPLNPLELMTLTPPEINLPPNVRDLARACSRRC